VTEQDFVMLGKYQSCSPGSFFLSYTYMLLKS
jgi:hypothetical protein